MRETHYRWLFRGILGVAALAALLFLVLPAQAGDGKVTICHVPPGNPENAHTITVNVHAVPAHLAHGDSIGECGGGPGSGRTSGPIH